MNSNIWIQRCVTYSLLFVQGIKFFEPEVAHRDIFSCIRSSNWFSPN